MREVVPLPSTWVGVSEIEDPGLGLSNGQPVGWPERLSPMFYCPSCDVSFVPSEYVICDACAEAEEETAFEVDDDAALAQAEEEMLYP